MRIGDIMSKDVCVAWPDQTIQEAANAMRETNVGALPVRNEERLVGLITDRDIAIRAVAAGKSADTPVREIMTEEVCYCFDDQPVAEIAENMAQIQVRRLPVVDRDKRLVGIISLADIALSGDDESSALQALGGISMPGEDATLAERNAQAL